MAVATFTWTTGTNGNFDVASNWTPAGFTSDAANTYAVIEPSGSPIITVSTSFTVFTLDMENPGVGINSALLEWDSSGAELTVGNTSTDGSVIINAGTVEIQSAAGPTSSLSIASNSGTVLSVGPGGTLVQQQGSIIAGTSVVVKATFAGAETFSGGIFSTPGDLTISGGSFTEQTGGSIAVGDLTNIAGGSAIISGGTFTTGTLTLNGNLTLSGGLLRTTDSGAGNSITKNDTLTLGGGTTTVLDFTNNGANPATGVIVTGVLTGSGTVEGVLIGTGHCGSHWWNVGSEQCRRDKERSGFPNCQ